MTITGDWWAHALGWGAVATAGVGAVLICVILLAPYTFFHDYPADIRGAAQAPTASQRRAGQIGGTVFMVTVLVATGAVPVTWGLSHPDAGFPELTLTALVVTLMFALFDILVVDWLVICTLRPSRIVYPGTEHCAGWRDYRFHVTDQLSPRGIAALAGITLVLGTVAWAVT